MSSSVALKIEGSFEDMLGLSHNELRISIQDYGESSTAKAEPFGSVLSRRERNNTQTHTVDDF
jgi:hypothetical protein